MTGNVFEAVKNAREFFCIQDFPGNLFTLVEKGDYAEKYKILLFKEDIEEREKYQRLLTPYLELEKKIDILVSRGKIGKATAESIKLRNGIGVV